MSLSPAGTVHIAADFATILSNYPANKQLPGPLQKTIDDLNKVKPGNTSCCLQVCWAFNKSGIKVPSGNFRPEEKKRVAAEIPYKSGVFYLMAVDEMINWMTGKFGPPFVLGDGPGADPKKLAAFTGPIQGLEGVLTFGNGHIELWNRYNIVQDTGASLMNAGWVWGKKPIRFWRIGNTVALPFTGSDMARFDGWWDVNDGTQYYYFIDLAKRKVSYTKRMPKNSAVRNLNSHENSGDVTLVGRDLVFDWDPAGGGATRETFTFDYRDRNTMTGRSNRYGNLLAKKMFV